MSPERKRAKADHNNTNDHSQEEVAINLDDIGVSMLPGSDLEDEAFSIEPYNQVPTDKSDESSVDSFVAESPSSVIKHSEEEMVTPPEQMMSYRFRRSVKHSCKQDVFALLSDEVILMIFKFLPQKKLPECVQVCQRWRQIGYDESLWQRIDLTSASIQTDYMAYIMQRNPIVLRMAQAEVMSPLFSERVVAMEDLACQVQYLDLSMALISSKDLADLLSKCQKLKKLSLEHCTTDVAVCSSIAANPDLLVLNMSQCYQLSAAGLEEILINCSELMELNLAWTRLDSECIDIVCKLVNENIHRLNLSGGLKRMKDSHVKELVKRCTCLRELDLSDCTELTGKCLGPIIKHLCDISELSFSRCYNILPIDYLKFDGMISLRYLNIFGLMQETAFKNFKQRFRTVILNQHEFSTVARPTVGIRRTSIWGHRVRDTL